MESIPAEPSASRSNRRLWVAIGVLVALWAAAMLFRWEIRTWWWGQQLVRAETPAARGYYLACLASVGDRAVGTAARLLDHPSAEVRLEATAVLQRCRSATARALLLRAMHDPDVDVREAAALGLAIHGDRAVLPDLLRMADSPHEGTSLAAAVALQRLGGGEAADALRRIAVEAGRPANLRAQAADSLGLIGDRQTVPVLIECLHDERALTLPPAAERALRRAAEALGADLARQGIDAGSLTAGGAAATVADVAARALQRITGESLGFSSTAPADRKAAAVRMYHQWWEAHQAP